MGWVVYVVRCSTGQLYTGITTDVDRRVKEHNLGSGARFTRTRRPVTLVYQESSRSRSAATVREFAIKKMTLKQKLSLVASRAPMA